MEIRGLIPMEAMQAVTAKVEDTILVIQMEEAEVDIIKLQLSRSWTPTISPLIISILGI